MAGTFILGSFPKCKILITQIAGTKTSFCWYGNQNINGMKTHANKLCTDVYAQIKIPIVYKCVFTCSQKLKNGDKVDHLTVIMPMHMQDLA